MGDALYSKDIECPLCSKEFSTPRVISYKLKLEDRDSDFCPYYKEEQSFYYEPTICPKCGYGNIADYFEEVTDEQKVKVIKKITKSWSGKDFSGHRDTSDAIKCYRHLTKNARAMELKASRRGTIFLRLAWCYRHRGSNKEKRTLRKALNHYKTAYQEEKLEGVNIDEITLTYLLGELHRRTGNRSKAVKYYSKVVEHPEIDSKPEVEKRARDQWQMSTKD